MDLSLVNNPAIHLPLRRHGLKLLCSLLSHRFRPGKEGQAGRETKLAMEALRSLLDGRTGEEERFDGGVELERVRQREAETVLQVIIVDLYSTNGQGPTRSSLLVLKVWL